MFFADKPINSSVLRGEIDRIHEEFLPHQFSTAKGPRPQGAELYKEQSRSTLADSPDSIQPLNVEGFSHNEREKVL